MLGLKTVPIRTFIIPGLVVVAVMFHMFGFFHHDRSSWGTGLSFGMFATAEAHGSRWLVVNRDEGERLVFDWGTCQSNPLVAKAIASPTQYRINLCANRLGGEVQLYGIRFDPSTAKIRSVLIRRSTSGGRNDE